jgi:hypothetical protein
MPNPITVTDKPPWLVRLEALADELAERYPPESEPRPPLTLIRGGGGEEPPTPLYGMEHLRVVVADLEAKHRLPSDRPPLHSVGGAAA